jgi:hypothetical protein
MTPPLSPTLLDEAPAPALQPPRRALALVEPTAPGVKALQLYEEARRASLEHVDELVSAVERARILADELVAGGDLYGAGLHDLARRLSEELLWKGRTLQVLAQRQRDTGGRERLTEG